MDSAVAQARPTGNLSNEWTYTSPEGIYFVGEGAVRYGGGGSDGQGVRENPAGQNIIAQLFGSESDTDTSSSHQHVIGAFQLLLSGAKSNRDVDADVNLLAITCLPILRCLHERRTDTGSRH
ncbi:hypothetical protein PC118_g19071 [Phytophthora cactorum]|uniref:Uncharacterized protein n=1 Tax=Phytophthora cactorum TaxID=29920 RepID=A0A8T1F864_9STRA|nr:hypothetical protein PC118_g19071 [Phytophthora cactorum]